MGDALIYDASRLAVGQSVVVVTIHYRLGVLGWFADNALVSDDSNREGQNERERSRHRQHDEAKCD